MADSSRPRPNPPDPLAEADRVLPYESRQAPVGMPKKFIARHRGDPNAKWKITLGCIIPMLIGMILVLSLPGLLMYGCGHHGESAPGSF